MLRSLKTLEGYGVRATDGRIGRVVNFLLDEEHWTVRYLIVETGGFFRALQVLISPVAFRRADWSSRRFHVALTKDKLKNSPSVDVSEPVSRGHEQDYFRYYGYPHYWGRSERWGVGSHPGLLAEGRWNEWDAADSDGSGTVHLRSATELRGYRVQGSDEAVGGVEDFIVDDETWEARYLVIDTSGWRVAKNKVLVAPRWASRVGWGEKKVYLDMPREVIKSSPEWNATSAIVRAYEARLHDHYRRPAYWDPSASDA